MNAVLHEFTVRSITTSKLVNYYHDGKKARETYMTSSG